MALTSKLVRMFGAAVLVVVMAPALPAQTPSRGAATLRITANIVPAITYADSPAPVESTLRTGNVIYLQYNAPSPLQKTVEQRRALSLPDVWSKQPSSSRQMVLKTTVVVLR